METSFPETIAIEMERLKATAADDSSSRIAYIDELFKAAGVPTSVVDADSALPSFYAKLPSHAPIRSPLLLYARLDSTGIGVAVLASVMLELRCRRVRLPYDLSLVIASGEDGEHSLARLTEKQSKLFRDIKYAIVSAPSIQPILGQKHLIPITTAEKRIVQVRITARGPGGNVSEDYTRKTSAITRITRATTLLTRKFLPVQVTEPVRLMSETMGKALGEADELLLRLLLIPRLSAFVSAFIGKLGRLYTPLLRNGICITAIHSDDCPGEIPQTACIDAEMCLLPGISSRDGVAILRSVIGAGYEIEELNDEAVDLPWNMTLLDGLFTAVKEIDETAKPLSYVSPLPTDASYLSRLGIQPYTIAPSSDTMKFWQDTLFYFITHRIE